MTGIVIEVDRGRGGVDKGRGDFGTGFTLSNRKGIEVFGMGGGGGKPSTTGGFWARVDLIRIGSSSHTPITRTR